MHFNQPLSNNVFDVLSTMKLSIFSLNVFLENQPIALVFPLTACKYRFFFFLYNYNDEPKMLKPAQHLWRSFQFFFPRNTPNTLTASNSPWFLSDPVVFSTKHLLCSIQVQSRLQSNKMTCLYICCPGLFNSDSACIAVLSRVGYLMYCVEPFCVNDQ